MTPKIRYEYGRPGHRPQVFEQWLVVDRDDVKVMLLEHHRGRTIGVNDTVVLEPGAPVIWFLFPGAWYDIGRFHLVDGTFTGWYTNFCTPYRRRGESWTSTDLFLDHWLSASGDHEWLDEHEFVQAVRNGTIDLQTRTRVATARAVVEQKIEQSEWPPRVAREIDLREVRRRMPPPSTGVP